MLRRASARQAPIVRYQNIMPVTALDQGGDQQFEWFVGPWGRALQCRPLAVHATHLFSTRDLALRGSEEETRAAWDALARDVGNPRSGIVRLKQVHGVETVVVGSG